MSDSLLLPPAALVPNAGSPPADISASPALTEYVEGPPAPDPAEDAVFSLLSSPRKQAANRANAQKSTGPRTPEGKERSSQNAVKHGPLSASVERLIAAATPEERQSYFQVIKQLFLDLLPVGAREHLLVERLAMLALRLLRVHQVEAAAMAERLASAARTGSPLTVVPQDLENILRYDTQAERSVQRTLRELRRPQHDRHLRQAGLDREVAHLLSSR